MIAVFQVHDSIRVQSEDTRVDLDIAGARLLVELLKPYIGETQQSSFVVKSRLVEKLKSDIELHERAKKQETGSGVYAEARIIEVLEVLKEWALTEFNLRPISTAPKDNTKILMYVHGGWRTGYREGDSYCDLRTRGWQPVFWLPHPGDPKKIDELEALKAELEALKLRIASLEKESASEKG